jgi:hypothetical protein
VAGLALSAANSALAQQPTPGGQPMRVVTHPTINNKACFFPIAQAYRASSESFDNTNVPAGVADCGGIRDNERWCGDDQTGEDNTTAAPGALALATRNAAGDDIRQRLDLNCFAKCPEGWGNAFVQSYRLTKKLPASRKCPGVFVEQSYIQFGTGIRTWWTLIYSPPGTTFTLDVTVRCTRPTLSGIDEVEIHIDRYIWKVVVSFESLQAVIDVLHSNTLGTSEIPCIAAENMYIALKQSVDKIEDELGDVKENEPVGQNIFDAQEALFNLEALIIAFCSFGDCFDSFSDGSPDDFPGNNFFEKFPPSNDVQVGPLGMLTGVLDTPENPCCCKLIVDIENLAIDYGIVTP